MLSLSLSVRNNSSFLVSCLSCSSQNVFLFFFFSFLLTCVLLFSPPHVLFSPLFHLHYYNFYFYFFEIKVVQRSYHSLTHSPYLLFFLN